MIDKSVIIVGGGIGGLSAGCYAQMNDYHTQIFEMHNSPGGLCTSWHRKGYNINGCMHLLVGCNENSDFYRVWEELGAIQGRKFLKYEDFVSFEGTDGRIFTLHGNIDKLEEHMMSVAPEDHKLIKEFIEGARGCVNFKPPIFKPPELFGPIEGLRAFFKIAPHLGLFRKWFKLSMTEFAKSFKSPLLQELFSHLWFPDSPVFFFMMTLSMLHHKLSGYPLEGSLPFAQAIENRYLNLGGQCHYGSRVSKILVENNRAVGIKLGDGSEHRADYVISAADGYSTIFDMLEGKYTNKKINGYYKKLPIFPPLIYISLGLKQPLDLKCGNSTGLNFPVKEPVTIAGEKISRLGVRIHDFDPTAAPSGKTLAKVLMPSNIAYWNSFNGDNKRYQDEKEKVCDQVVSLLDQRFPGLASTIEMRDIASPTTFIRYTENWQGSHQGWMVTPKTGIYRMKNVLPGLKNFYMAGHWVQPGGGVPTAALSGRNVTQFLCKQDKKSFITKVP
ncbi:MAG: NAD(P)/FAD-dependent oxidoreductase [Desulfobacteraceae bacterium]|nr:NAD(P)/FAD-dependent oxidoreductase [Desulfobacteraceae bacterium]